MRQRIHDRAGSVLSMKPSCNLAETSSFVMPESYDLTTLTSQKDINFLKPNRIIKKTITIKKEHSNQTIEDMSPLKSVNTLIS